MLDLKIINNKVIACTLSVAEDFSKEHKNVMQAIGNLDCSQEFRELNYKLTSYTSAQNKILPSYEMTKDGFVFLCMGFRGPKAAEFKEDYIKAFNIMNDALINGNELNSFDDINMMIKGIEDLNQVGSVHGKGLAEYAKKKKARVLEYQTAIDSVQMVLNIK